MDSAGMLSAGREICHDLGILSDRRSHFPRMITMILRSLLASSGKTREIEVEPEPVWSGLVAESALRMGGR
jgi:hypothetical protein